MSALTPPIKAEDYYELLPKPDHQTGDIWRNLPGFSIIGETVSGIVITPACDLAARKCETVTYLPIISVDDYLTSSDFYVECWKEAATFLNKLKTFELITRPDRFELPDINELKDIKNMHHDSGKKELSAADLVRLDAFIEYINSNNSKLSTSKQVRAFFKKDRFDPIIQKIATNSFKPDIHFLPHDGHDGIVSAVPKHSVILFRYPLSIPIKILDIAANSTENQWSSYIEKEKNTMPSIEHCKKWPLRLTTVRTSFLGDIIARYISMYVRLGSPDFSKDQISKIVGKIGV